MGQLKQLKTNSKNAKKIEISSSTKKLHLLVLKMSTITTIIFQLQKIGSVSML